jgi:hypothetical protein
MAKRKPTQIVQVGTRMPESLRASLDKAAKANGISLNAEIVQRLEDSFLRAPVEEVLEEAKTLTRQLREDWEKNQVTLADFLLGQEAKKK